MIVQSFDARPYADETAVGSILNAMRGISMVHRATPYVAEGDTAVYVVDALKSASERQLKALDEFDFELLMLVPGSTQIRVRFGREAIRTEDLNWSPDFDWYLRVTWSGPSK